MPTETTSKNPATDSPATAPYMFGPARLMAHSVGLVLVGAAGPMIASGTTGAGLVALATAIVLLAVSLYLGASG